MTQGATEKPAANAGRDAERPPHLFKPGQSGNPAGKKPGTRNRATRALEELLEGQGAALTQKAIDMALAGDVTALKLCIERICPVRRDRPVRFKLPAVTSARDAADISAAVMVAVSNGDLTLSEASEIGKLIDGYVKAYQVAELDDRTARVEQMTDEELMRIIRNGESTPPRLLTIGPG